MTVPRPLGPQHAPELQAFECHRFKQPWTIPVESLIREQVASALGAGQIEGIGIWGDDGLLSGVAAWSPDPSGIWTCNVVAVRVGQMGRGLGRQLKQEVLNRARIAGATRVVSLVHRDNKAMTKVNDQFHASFTVDPHDHEYFICTVVL